MRFGEKGWFERWVPTIRGKLVLYEQVFDDLYLRPADIEPVIETSVCADILREAVNNHQEAWHTAGDLFGREAPLSAIIGRLFNEDVPPSVAVTALRELLRNPEYRASALDEKVVDAIAARDQEMQKTGVPSYLWVVRMAAQGKMTVSVEERCKGYAKHLGLVCVVDARRRGGGKEEG